MEVNNSDNEDLQNDDNLRNHPLIRLMMSSTMIPTQMKMIYYKLHLKILLKLYSINKLLMV